MANDNQTALMMSIARNKNRLEFIKLCPSTDATTAIKHELMDIITEDEKLLAVDREKGIELIAIGIHSDSYNGSDEDTSMMATKLFDEKYGTDGK